MARSGCSVGPFRGARAARLPPRPRESWARYRRPQLTENIFSSNYIYSQLLWDRSLFALVRAQTAFGATLKRLRIQSGMTQEELAFAADLSVVYLRGLEGGRNNPTLNVLFNIGRAVGIHPSELLKDIPLEAETHGTERKRPGPPEGTLRGPKGRS